MYPLTQTSSSFFQGAMSRKSQVQDSVLDKLASFRVGQKVLAMKDGYEIEGTLVYQNPRTLRDGRIETRFGTFNINLLEATVVPEQSAEAA